MTIAPSRVNWSPQGPRKAHPSADRPPLLDLSERLDDLRSIARSQSYWRRCLAAGLTADELDQELTARLLKRQRMASRYNPKRGSLGKYLWTFTASNLLQLWQKAKRAASKRESEQADPEPWNPWRGPDEEPESPEDAMIERLDEGWRDDEPEAAAFPTRLPRTLPTGRARVVRA